ncbi:hypothetical protein EON76_04840 [bacterium]|nr:MAG: hypothetical protein EON76_04840 [bacterium]
MDNQNNDAVWIDREEYARLKALDSQQHAQQQSLDSSLPAAHTPQGVITGSPQQPSEKKAISPLTILTGVFAVLSFIFPPATLVFLILGIMTMIQFFKGKSSKKTKTGVGIVLAAGIAIALTIVGPFILLFGFIIMWQIGCWTGLGSCTSV